MTRRVAIAGASGVIGCAAVEACAAAGFEVLAISRRAPAVAEGTAFTHLSLDLTDTAACTQMCREHGPVTHLVYAAVSEQAGLVAGWSDTAQIARNAAMFTNLAAPLAQAGALSWIGLFQGTKAYGAHLHPIALPAREDAPRDDHANFYFEQEDALRALADRHAFGWTILRPQIVFGSAPGAAMNPVAALGAYAALCRELGQPFAYPASGPLVWEAADAGLIAKALLWAMSADGARNATFNLTNGDIFVLHDDWPTLATALGLVAADPRPGGIATFLESDKAIAAWRRIAEREGLREPDLAAVIGQSHHYVDLLLSERMIAKRALPTLVSTIKIRTAGFAACRDSLASLLDGLKRMQALRLLPSF
ncbi:NAD-dependent epimerase/dehydratase family protein [Novosphingobium sp. JCM 18896]|uniref:NAD-dependent epimerase/dehydratase family protein n=1 Tax=Novosphingobium sp. JCM 18896 TaxID=2989731 RepID=UPI002222D8E9|nr:NAD-dependent epimerase/dehydratase family protein [Novosphingobium sp. JCM 18896]MCW1431711.1 NAD-dependent epimerase/dehydratase family protein [Novosphingobium sp. JCM 18896]